MHDVDGAIRRGLDRGNGCPLYSRRQLAPVPCRRIRLGKVVARFAVPLRIGRDRGQRRQGEDDHSAAASHRAYYSESLDSMPRLTNKDAIRAILRRDPAWCVYALGDLSPEMFPKTEWFTPDLSLVLKDYGTSILFAMGAGSIDEALEIGRAHV